MNGKGVVRGGGGGGVVNLKGNFNNYHLLLPALLILRRSFQQ